MSEGDTQEAPSELENAYAGFFAPETESDLTTDAAEDGGDDKGEEAESTQTETQKAAPANSDWETRYKEANNLIGRQGNELGQLRKEMADLKASLQTQQQTKTDPFEKYPQLKALDPEKRDFALQTSSAALERLLGDHGLTMEDIKQAKVNAEYATQRMTEDQMMREIGDLKREFGEESFGKYVPAMQKINAAHPDLSPQEVWDLATAKDSRKSQTERAKAMEKERKERAKSADFGNERPVKTSSRLSSEDVQKLSNKGSGKPSPRFKALYRETMKELGG